MTENYDDFAETELDMAALADGDPELAAALAKAVLRRAETRFVVAKGSGDPDEYAVAKAEMRELRAAFRLNHRRPGGGPTPAVVAGRTDGEN